VWGVIARRVVRVQLAGARSMSLRPLSRISPIPNSDIHPSFDEGQSNRGGVPSEIERDTRAVATTPETP